MKNVKWQALIALIILMHVISSTSAQTTQSPIGTKLQQSFEIIDAYGRKTELSKLQNKVVFINFWSLTCAPCKAEMPTINNLKERFKNDTDFILLPVDLDRNFREDQLYFNIHALSLGIYAPTGAVPRSLFMGELPTTVVIDRKGTIVFYQQGKESYDTPEFYHVIDSLLSQ